MQTVTVLTGTVTSLVTGENFFVAVYVPLDPAQVLAWVVGLFVVLTFFFAVQRFQMWALTIGSAICVLDIPFALTGYGPYYVILALFFLMVMSAFHFFTKGLFK